MEHLPVSGLVGVVGTRAHEHSGTAGSCDLGRRGGSGDARLDDLALLGHEVAGLGPEEHVTLLHFGLVDLLQQRDALRLEGLYSGHVFGVQLNRLAMPQGGYMWGGGLSVAIEVLRASLHARLIWGKFGARLERSLLWTNLKKNIQPAKTEKSLY